jgi:hypothetical protein
LVDCFKDQKGEKSTFQYIKLRKITMDIHSKEFYVYGLLDPDTNEVFYIGKGKGNRAQQHLKEKKLPGYGNHDKLNKIKNILESKKEVKIIYYIENLSEYAAFILEEILIERIGRRFYGGTLTNVTDAGPKEHYKLSVRGQDEIEKEKINIDIAISKYPEPMEIIYSVPRFTKEEEDEIIEKERTRLERVELDKIYVMQFIQSFDQEIFNDIEANKIVYYNSYFGREICFECKYGTCIICLGDKETEKRKIWYSASVHLRNGHNIIYKSDGIPPEQIAEKLRLYMNLMNCGGNIYFQELGPIYIPKESKRKSKISINKPLPIFESYPVTKMNEIKISAPFNITNVKIIMPSRQLPMPCIFNQEYNSKVVEINTELFAIGKYSISVYSRKDLFEESEFEPIYNMWMVKI